MFHFHNSSVNKIQQNNNNNSNHNSNYKSNKQINKYNNKNNSNNYISHKMHLQSAKTLSHHHLAPSYGWMQVFLLLTLFVIGNQSAWQENIRPKLYVELGKFII